MGEPDLAPDLRDVYDSLEWHRRAACIGEDRLFLADRALGRPKNLGSTSLTLALADLLDVRGSARVSCRGPAGHSHRARPGLRRPDPSECVRPGRRGVGREHYG